MQVVHRLHLLQSKLHTNAVHSSGSYHIAMTYLSLSPYASTKLALSVLSGLILSFAASSLPLTGVSGISTSLASHLVHSSSMKFVCESQVSVRCHSAIAGDAVDAIAVLSTKI
jgi:hypothetical protein